MNESHDPDEYQHDDPPPIAIVCVMLFLYTLYCVAIYHFMTGK
jgi:hypothetical protein